MRMIITVRKLPGATYIYDLLLILLISNFLTHAESSQYALHISVEIYIHMYFGPRNLNLNTLQKHLQTSLTIIDKQLTHLSVFASIYVQNCPGQGRLYKKGVECSKSLIVVFLLRRSPSLTHLVRVHYKVQYSAAQESPR
jgi:hypothetical protein